MLSFFRRRPLVGVIGCALVLRVAAAVGVQYQLDHVWQRTFVIEGDSAGYWDLGQDLAAGAPYEVHEPPRRVLRMPGFPALLAVGIALSNGSFLGVRLLLAVMGAGACGLVYVLGRTLFDARIGLVASGLAAVSPVMIGFSVMILSETLFAAALVASLVGLARLVQTGFAREARGRGLAWSAAAGLLVALATYVRPTWLVAGPLFALVYVVASRGARGQAILRGGVLVGCLCLALVPWAARNKAVTGHWVWTTLWVGPSLYDGLNPAATGESDMTFFDRERLPERMSEYEVDRHYRRRAWEFVQTHPGRALELALMKLWRYWKPWPNAEQFGGFWQQAAVAAFFLPALVLAGVGAWSQRGRAWECGLAAAPLLLFAVVHMVFVSSLRYRLPAEYPLYVLTAAGLVELLRRRRSPMHPRVS
jgi:4-amino-4-deoxy-L-arabinose transferase-like glycosyltransferase